MSTSDRYWKMVAEALEKFAKDIQEGRDVQARDLAEALQWAVIEEVEITMTAHVNNDPHFDPGESVT